jgi:signal transduction histidine kinase
VNSSGSGKPYMTKPRRFVIWQSVNLWGALVLFVFLIMLSAAVLMTFLTFLVVGLNLVRTGHPNVLLVVALVLLTSMLIGTAITAVLGRRILGPITGLSEAAKEVAKGHFNISLPYEDHKIRELGEMAANFNKMVQELNGIETLRNDFVVNVSHEFKTPLSSIEGYAALMQDPELKQEDRKEYSRLIMESTRQLSSLCSNVLKLSKLENQEFVVEKEEFRLDEQIRQALLLLEPQWSGKNLLLDIDMEPQHFWGSEEMLMQVWLNVIGNAVKFSHEGGSIAVTLHCEGGQASVVVADDGVGMSEEVQRHIFEKFYQGDHSRTAEGNGLGLALVRRILTLCGGEISVESTVGQGTVFTVTLPLENV